MPSVIAVSSLMNPNAEPEPIAGTPQSSASTQPAKPRPATILAPRSAPLSNRRSAPNSGKLPLWLFGAIAAGCMASCFVLARQMQPIEGEIVEGEVTEFEGTEFEGTEFEGTEFEETTAALPSFLASWQSAIEFSNQPFKRLKPYESSEALVFATPEIQSARSQPIQPLTPDWVDAANYPLEPVPVTVVAPEESEPIDWGEARLADVMDLRRRYPLHLIANNLSQS